MSGEWVRNVILFFLTFFTTCFGMFGLDPALQQNKQIIFIYFFKQILTNTKNMQSDGWLLRERKFRTLSPRIAVE